MNIVFPTERIELKVGESINFNQVVGDLPAERISGSLPADQNSYDNTESGLDATNVQDALDELASKPSVDAYTKQESDEKYATKTELSAKADVSAIPTKTSDLQNDSGFAQIDDSEASASNTYSSDKIDDLLDEKVDTTTIDEFTEQTSTKKEWQDVVSENTHSGNRIVYNAQYQRITQGGTDSGMSYDVYPVTAGRYRITGHGNDTTAGVMACVGNADIIESGASYCTLLQVINTGSSTYTKHTVEVDIAQNGFLYVNYVTTGTHAKCEKEVSVGVTTVKTDSSLTDLVLPANASAVGKAIRTHGVIKNGDSYTNFSYSHDDKYILRTIAKSGANNLYDYKSLEIGHLEDGAFVVDTTIWSAFTDQLGPVSMRLNGSGANNMWTGGVHTVTIDDTAYPTAETKSINVYVDGVDITNSADGIYFGDCRIVAVNNLYAPQTITGADLSTATLAIEETRTFILTDTLKVQVKLVFKEDSIVGLYYGMQNQDNHTSTILLPTVGKELARADMSSGAVSNSKEWAIMLSDNNHYHFDMLLDYFGLGNWDKNDGTSAYGRISHYATTKIYFVLCSGGTFNQGDIMFWQGEYRTYHD